MTHHLDLAALDLKAGGHGSRSGGVCLMEAVAWWAGEKHTDRPECVSPVLGAFGRELNDRLPDDKRQELKPLIPRLPGTSGDGQDKARGYLALDWLTRVYTPAWLELAGLAAEASSLRELRRVAGLAAAQKAGPVVSGAQAAANAAWAAARAAARDAARDVLAPTVARLQDSAIALFGQMIEPAA